MDPDENRKAQVEFKKAVEEQEKKPPEEVEGKSLDERLKEFNAKGLWYNKGEKRKKEEAVEGSDKRPKRCNLDNDTVEVEKEEVGTHLDECVLSHPVQRCSIIINNEI